MERGEGIGRLRLAWDGYGRTGATVERIGTVTVATPPYPASVPRNPYTTPLRSGASGEVDVTLC